MKFSFSKTAYKVKTSLRFELYLSLNDSPVYEGRILAFDPKLSRFVTKFKSS